MPFTRVMVRQTPHKRNEEGVNSARYTYIKTQSLQTVSQSNDDDDDDDTH